MSFLRDPDNYPLFGKPIDGKYSISVISADAYDQDGDKVIIQGGETVSPEALAGTMTGRQAGVYRPAATCSVRST